MELYSILSVFFIIGFIGICFINRKEPNVFIRQKLWVKYFVYLVLVFVQMFLIHSHYYTYFASLLVLIGFYEIIKVKIETKSFLMALVSFSIFSVLYLSFSKEIALKWQLFLFVIVITFDGYSQISGQLLGKTKLVPNISPNKTVEGFLFGLFSVATTALILSQILVINPIKALIYGLSIALFSLFGDLAASQYKRINKVKDYSKIIPGHGGVLDRFDSLIIASSGFYFVLQFTLTMAIQTTILYMLFFLLVFIISEYLYHSLKVRVEVSRKWVHVLSGMICLTFPFYITSHWIVLLLCSSFMIVLYSSTHYNFLQSVNGIARKSFGSILFPVAIYFSFLSFQFLNRGYIYFYLPILILSICDPIAALVGKKWAIGRYRIGNDYKTIMGSTAFFASSFVILFFSLLFYFPNISCRNLFLYSSTIAAFTAFTEAFSQKGIDNIAIPSCVLLSLLYVL